MIRRIRWLATVALMRITRPALTGAQRLGPRHPALSPGPYPGYWRLVGRDILMLVARITLRGAERLAPPRRQP
jgi:hypothetical protein